MNKRNPNFSNTEIDALLSMVADRKHILECKKSDAVSAKKKEETWKEIEKLFNSGTSNFRNYKELRKKYENLKAHAKKTSSEEARYRYGTGGGSPKKSKLTDTDLVILDTLPGSEVHGLNSQYDNDYIPAEKTKQDDEIEASITEILDGDDNDKNQEINNTWEKFSVENLKKPKNKKLETRQSEKNSSSSWSKLANIKSKWTEEKFKLENEIIKEQHEEFLKTKKMERQFLEENQEMVRAAHKADMDDREMIRKKHKLEIEILQLELQKKKNEIL